MKITLLSLLLIFLLASCTADNSSPKETVTSYYTARNTGDFNTLKMHIQDSITITEGDYVMPYSRETFYEVFKWDSVFRPTYTIAQLEEKDHTIVASVTLTSARNTFLENPAMTCDYTILFTAGKISKIETGDCTNVDWQVWSNKVNTLVQWVDTNHPELNGFIYDMTMEGAQKYLKAIALYEKAEGSR